MNIFKPLQSRGSNSDNAHEQMQSCMSILRSLASTAKQGDENGTMVVLRQLLETINKSELPINIREKFIEEGKKYTLAIHRLKLQEYFDKAFSFTRSGNNEQREEMIHRASECIEAMNHLVNNEAFIEEMHKRLEVLRQTSQAGTSDLAKTDNQENSMQTKQGAGKRRYLRYDSPTFWVKLPKEAQPYRTLDYSLTGMLLEGIPPSVKEGSKVHVIITIANEEVEKYFEGTITINRILTEKNATALSFITAEGPVMFFIRNRLLDLSTKRPI
ncbi:MAG: PilZ domain-containing protein [Candidatus Pacebacteria bacterium]|nr:PilZ domain-containing protein [Candidatus Paceibacterota bacterium]